MIRTRPATEPETRAWRDDWRTRLDAWYGIPGALADWRSEQVGDRFSVFDHASESLTLTLTDGDTQVGVLALVLNEFGGRREAVLADLWVAPERRRQGLGTHAVHHAEQWASERQASMLWTVTAPDDPAQEALFARYPVRGYQMIKELAGPDELPGDVDGRPMTDAEFAEWRAEMVRDYAADIRDSGSLVADEAQRSAERQTNQILPQGMRTPGHAFLCLCAGGEVVATNWILHHRSPGVSWVYGVETHEGHRGKGFGRAAMVIGERATLEAGDTYLALNVFGHNNVAIGLYRSMGYRAYDIGRSLEL